MAGVTINLLSVIALFVVPVSPTLVAQATGLMSGGVGVLLIKFSERANDRLDCTAQDVLIAEKARLVLEVLTQSTSDVLRNDAIQDLAAVLGQTINGSTSRASEPNNTTVHPHSSGGINAVLDV